MINTRFEAYKIRRELKRSGIDLVFERPVLNAFKEPTKETAPLGTLRCLYHEQNGYIKITTGDTTQTRTKKTPMLLCLYEDADALKLQVDDQVKINSKTFKVTDVMNVQEWNIVADISLEVVDVGVPA